MRRTDREITQSNMIEEMIRRCDICRVAFFDQEYPYIVPMNFGFCREEDRFIFYFHGARDGKKLDLLRKNHHVGFELDSSHQLLTGAKGCDATMLYESVCGTGRIELVEDETERVKALNCLMEHYTGIAEHQFDTGMLQVTAILKLTVHTVTGKAHK